MRILLVRSHLRGISVADVEALCKRVIVTHHGTPLYDGDLTGLGARFAAYKTISASFDQAPPALDGYGEVMSTDGLRVTLRVPKAETSRVTARLLTDLAVVDLTVEDPPIDDVIEKVFNSQVVGYSRGRVVR